MRKVKQLVVSRTKLIRGCVGVFDGLEDYANEPADGATIGKVTHKETGDKEVEFTVEALMIGKKGQAKDGGERSEL